MSNEKMGTLFEESERMFQASLDEFNKQLFDFVSDNNFEIMNDIANGRFNQSAFPGTLVLLAKATEHLGSAMGLLDDLRNEKK